MLRSSTAARLNAQDALKQVSSADRGTLGSLATTVRSDIVSCLDQIDASAFDGYIASMYEPVRITNMLVRAADKESLAGTPLQNATIPHLVAFACPALTAAVSAILKAQIPTGTNGGTQALAMLVAASSINVSVDLCTLACAVGYWGGGNKAIIRAIFVLRIPPNGPVASAWAYTNLPKLAMKMDDTRKNQVLGQVRNASIDGSQLDGVEFGDALNGANKVASASLITKYLSAFTQLSDANDSIGTDPLSKHGLELIFAIIALRSLFNTWDTSVDPWNNYVMDSLTLRGAVLTHEVASRKIPYIPYAYLIIQSMSDIFVTTTRTEVAIRDTLCGLCVVSAVGQFGDALVTDITKAAETAVNASGSFTDRGMAKVAWFLRQTGPYVDSVKEVFTAINTDYNAVKDIVQFSRSGMGSIAEVNVTQLRAGFLGIVADGAQGQ